MHQIHRVQTSNLATLQAGSRQQPAVVLLHGIFDSASSWLSIVEALSDNYFVVAVDLPGHGTSPSPESEFTVPSLAHAVMSTLREVEVNRFDLIGHSLGGLVAHQLALTEPAAVRTLTLEDPAWNITATPQAAPEYLRVRASELRTWSAKRILDEGRRLHPEWDERDLAGWFEAKVDADTGVLDLVQDWRGDTGAGSWGTYRGITLLMTGNEANGAIVTTAMVAEAQSALGDRLVHAHFPDCGHDIRKAARGPFLRALRDFIPR